MSLLRRLVSHCGSSGGVDPKLSSPKHGWLLMWAFLTRRQLDYVASQKTRRALSMVGLHSNLWERETFFKLLINSAKKLFARHHRFLLGLSLLSSSTTSGRRNLRIGGCSEYWRSHRLSDELLDRHKDDVRLAKRLTETTLTCLTCHKRLVVESMVEGVDYCECAKPSRRNYYGVQTNDIPWTPFLERKDILVWRQEHPESPGTFVYKMYGSFDEITPREFLEVQLDLTEFRLSWDVNAHECAVLDEELDEESNSLSQVYYWEVVWPRFFSNRDYVCNRRSKIFHDERVAVIYSKATNHPAAPARRDNYRVGEYWSVVALQPTGGDWDSPGLEFVVTAYENPGLSLPAYITTWVAMRGMPEFMGNLRQACLDLRLWKKEQNINSAEHKKNSDNERKENDGDLMTSSAVKRLTPTSSISSEIPKQLDDVPFRPQPQHKEQQQQNRGSSGAAPTPTSDKKYFYVNVSL